MVNSIEDARSRRSVDIERFVRDALTKLSNKGCRISFYSVAKEASVSRSALYRNDHLRQMVESAREGGMQSYELSDIERLEARVAALEAEVSRLRKAAERSEIITTASDSSVAYWAVDLSKVA